MVLPTLVTYRTYKCVFFKIKTYKYWNIHNILYLKKNKKKILKNKEFILKRIFTPEIWMEHYTLKTYIIFILMFYFLKNIRKY